MQRCNFQMAVKTVEPTAEGAVKISGYASTPDVDRYRDIVEPTAFKAALDMYFKNPVLLRSHNPDRPAGTVTSAVVDRKGLKIEAVVLDEQTKTEVLDGRMRALSIGYIPLASELQHEDGTPFNAEKDSPWDNDLIRKITQLDLAEISIVAVPANGHALFTVAKSVQKHFANLATKAFGMSKKDGEELPDNEVEASTLPVPEKTEEAAETVEPKVPAEEEAAKVEATEKTEEEVEADKTEKVETTETTEQTAAEAVTPPQPKEDDQLNGTENAGETPAAPVSESEKADGDKGEVAEAGGSEGEQEKAFALDTKSAALLPELVEAGLAKVDEKLAEIPAGFVQFTKQLLEVSAKQAAEIVALTTKLDEVSVKKPLAPVSQFDATVTTKAGAAATEPEKKSGGFIEMIKRSANGLTY